MDAFQQRPVTVGAILHIPNRDWLGIVDISDDDWDNNFKHYFVC